MEEDDDSDWRTARYDPRIPLGRPRAAHVEYGESINEYYRKKHSEGRFGKYYGLHEIDIRPW